MQEWLTDLYFNCSDTNETKQSNYDGFFMQVKAQWMEQATEPGLGPEYPLTVPYSRQLPRVLLVLETTASWSARIRDNCLVFCSYSRKLSRVLLVLETTASCSARTRDNCLVFCSYTRKLPRVLLVLETTASCSARTRDNCLVFCSY
jgi:hypothetical protein